MKLHPSNLVKVILLNFALFLSISCNKDSDLLAEFVVEDPQNIFLKDLVIATMANQPIVIEPLGDKPPKEPEKIIITAVSSPNMGMAEVKEDNTITYTPDTDKTGTDVFDYTARIINPDETVSTETNKITVNVTDIANIDYGPLKAFPSAYGAGANASGARASKTATVYHVTNLNDSGPGSLREGISGPGTKNNRYIVFDVSGTIYLRSTLHCHASNITIAGQTAPAGGITLAGARMQFGGNPAPTNIIIRYLTIRPDFKVAEQDALTIYNSKNIILDHVSISWGTDEVFSFAGDVNNVTMQRMLIAESNKTGTILGNTNAPGNGDQFSIHNNLWYNISHRFPNVSTNGQADIINNVVYNWNHRLVNAMGGLKLNHINNYYFRQKSNSYTNNLNKYNGSLRSKSPQIYTAGNLIMPNIFTDPSADNWSLWTSFGSWTNDLTSFIGTKTQALPITFKSQNQHALLGVPLPVQSADAAYKDVVYDVGNNKRIDQYGNVIRQIDKIDLIYLQNVRNDTPTNYTYGSKTQIPNLAHYLDFKNSISDIPENKHPSTHDTDGDGMPDEWEKLRGFDPNKKDHNEDKDGNGYTNLEEFLNLVDF